MPLKLTAGVSEKLGLPGYSSVADLHVELELDNGLIQADPEAFRPGPRGLQQWPSRSMKSWPGRRHATGPERLPKCLPRDWPRPTVRALSMATGTPRAMATATAMAIRLARQRKDPLAAVGPPIGIHPGPRRPARHGCRADRGALSATVREAPRRAFHRPGERANPRFAGNAGRLAGTGRDLSPRGRVRVIAIIPIRMLVGNMACDEIGGVTTCAEINRIVRSVSVDLGGRTCRIVPQACSGTWLAGP